MTSYTMRVETALPFDAAVERTREALAEQGFGVLTEIDVRATMKAKLDVDVPAHVILGACRPQLAHRAMSAAPSISALLPCNVVVRESGDGRTEVEVIDPAAMSQLEGQPAIADVAAEARIRLRAALDRIVLQEA
ncbi:MAG: DUF302 domain-containing protein [Nocardioides sp.]|nr:DUF302 domain-containing protein [Nocardioides sp.]